MTTKIVRRNSKQKEVVFASVARLANHPTAEQVFAEAKKIIPKISLSTVYRNLAILSKNGDLLSIANIDSEVHYDHNVFEHYHVLCSNCGKIEDFIIPPEKIRKIFTKELNGFQIEGFSVIVKGLCTNCKKQLT